MQDDTPHVDDLAAMLAALDAALASDRRAHARAERAEAFALAWDTVGEALL
jgi:hypothetical protein